MRAENQYAMGAVSTDVELAELDDMKHNGKSRYSNGESAPDDLNPNPVTRNQDYIASVVHNVTGFDEKDIKKIFNEGWEAICRELENGNTVKLHGKGSFYLSKRSGRMGRNPETGEEYPIPERDAMAFRTSPAYAKRLREVRDKKRKISKNNIN